MRGTGTGSEPEDIEAGRQAGEAVEASSTGMDTFDLNEGK